MLSDGWRFADALVLLHFNALGVFALWQLAWLFLLYHEVAGIVTSTCRAGWIAGALAGLT